MGNAHFNTIICCIYYTSVLLLGQSNSHVSLFPNSFCRSDQHSVHVSCKLTSVAGLPVSTLASGSTVRAGSGRLGQSSLVILLQAVLRQLRSFSGNSSRDENLHGLKSGMAAECMLSTASDSDDGRMKHQAHTGRVIPRMTSSKSSWKVEGQEEQHV